MARGVYLTAMGPASGKSIVALGVVELLSRRVSRIGFFRPIVRAAEPADNDLELIRRRYRLDTGSVGYGLTSDQVRGLVAGGRTEAADLAMTEVVGAYKALEARCDVVVIEGTDFTGVSSPLEFDVNARVAQHLRAPVLAVVNGHGRSPTEIAGAVRFAEESLVSQGDALLAVVVNRVEPMHLQEVKDVLAARSGDAPPAYAIPEDEALRHPSLAELARALDAELIAGTPEDLARDVRHVKVAAMSVPNLLDHLERDTVLISPGDRPDVLVTAALTRQSETYPSVAGVLLSGGLRPDPRVAKLVEGLSVSSKPLPMLVVSTDTIDTAGAAAAVEGQITPNNERKIEAALGLFEAHVDVAELEARIRVAQSSVVTPVMFQYELIERAKAACAHIVLPEGEDDRILEAAERLTRRKVGTVTLLGREADVRQRASELGLRLEGVDVIDPVTSPWLEGFAHDYHQLRANKGMAADMARDLMTDVSFFGTMMVHTGLADGMVSGAAHTTAHTIRPAFEIIRTQPGVSIVSSVFLMLLADRVLVYGDCAVNPDPNARQLADIAISSAATAQQFGIEPRIAMLSYSTGTSGAGADVDKVREATERVRSARPDLKVEGPIQYDAAVDASVARTKLPESEVAGQATVFIFPDLNTGNNTYKAVQRTAGAVAVGPVLQGLNRPVNDLSRGATVTDIVNTVAITGIQARERPDLMRVLVLNTGSSSIKYQVIQVASGGREAGGLVEEISDHRDGLRRVVDELGSLTPAAVGHRVVHGGEAFTAPTLIDDEVLCTLRELVPLAPLHNPANIAGIEVARAQWPDVAQVAVFDTAFHRTLPPHAYRYAVPAEWYERDGVRRYGFHGTSHEYVAGVAAEHLARPLDELNLIVAHLGNGASITAVARGCSVDTSMGLSPLEGLVMGTRSGDVDPTVVSHVAQASGRAMDDVLADLNRASGLRGLCGVSDMREVITRVDDGDEAAALALAVFCYRIKKYVGAYLAVLGRCDALVFTGGIGEHSARVRAGVCAGLEGLGITVDSARNAAQATVISPDRAVIAVLAVATDEELAIARQTAALVAPR